MIHKPYKLFLLKYSLMLFLENVLQFQVNILLSISTFLECKAYISTQWKNGE
jgi:hypothetical protein